MKKNKAVKPIADRKNQASKASQAVKNGRGNFMGLPEDTRIILELDYRPDAGCRKEERKLPF